MSSGLPWVRIDSDIAANPRIAGMIAEHGEKGIAAAFVFVASIGYAGAHNTDGAIWKTTFPFIHCNPQRARLLVEAGLWEESDGSWRIASYDESQPTKSTAELAAQMRSEKARAAANKRWGND